MKKVRGKLYKLARLLGDATALLEGNGAKRIARRAAGKATGKALKGLFKN